MKPSRVSAYTLAEILVAMGIAAIVSAGVLALFVQNLSTQGMSAGKLLLNNDIRKITTEMSEEARDATFYRVYPGFNIRFMDTNGDGVLNDGELDLPNGLASGQSGDYLVLYFVDPTGALEPGTTRRRIVKTIGYYRAPDPDNPSGAGPVRRHVSTVNPGTLPSPGLIDAFPEVVELSRGLSDGRLFYNFRGSVVIHGELEHPGNVIRKATNTYNLTITPRG